MAHASGGCPACGRVARVRSGEDPELIAELSESYAVLGDSQHWEGWCVLLLKEHHEHLADLPIERQTRLFGDVARVAAAIRAVCSPRRINYECLGNVLAHVHWHVVPRYAPGRRAGGDDLDAPGGGARGARRRGEAARPGGGAAARDRRGLRLAGLGRMVTSAGAGPPRRGGGARRRRAPAPASRRRGVHRRL